MGASPCRCGHGEDRHAPQCVDCGCASFARRMDSWDKIRLKGGPKQYKSGGPGPSGRHLLARQVNALTMRAYKLLRKADHRSADALYAQALYDALKTFSERLQTVLDAE